MKRLRVIMLFLLLGAIVNVAVAWGIALLAPTGPQRLAVYPFGNNRWAVVSIYHGLGVRRISGYSLATESTAMEMAKIHPREIVQLYWVRDVNWAEARHSADGIWFEDVRGWPLPCLWWTFRWDTRNQNPPYNYYVDAQDPLIPLSPHQGSMEQLRALPLYPIWRAFLANSVMYSVFLWILIHCTFVLRRFIRHKRGLCVKCAYDLQGADHEACPECGEEIRKGNPE